MTSKPRQFFQEDAGDGTAPTKRQDVAVYSLPAPDGSEGPILIAVEVVPGGGNSPRNATSFRDAASTLQTNVEKELKSIAAMGEVVVESFKRLRPGAIEVEFGVELGGEAGIPLITKSAGKATFKITLKWQPEQVE